MSNKRNDIKQRCIFCLKSPPEVKMNREHVFPDAIGGTLCIQSVCTDCNSRHGHKVDFNLTDDWYVVKERVRLAITDSRGNIRLPVRYVSLPPGFGTQRAELYADLKKRQILHRLVPVVEEDEANSRFVIHLDQRDGEEKYTITNKKLAKRGVPPMTKEQIDKVFVEREIPPFEARIQPPGNNGQIMQAMIKIAYELAWYWIGDAYLQDQTGQMLRSLVLDSSFPDNDWERRYPLQGGFRFLDETNQPLIPDFPDAHLALLWEMPLQLVLYLRIFSVYELWLSLSNAPQRYEEHLFGAIRSTSSQPRSRLILMHGEQRRLEES